MLRSIRWLRVSFVVLTVIAASGVSQAADSGTLFAERILPIAKSKQESSCAACHFGGVRLSQYVLDTEADTFAALRDAGLVDTERPESSKLLEFLSRTPENATAAQDELRQREWTAFRDWLTAASANPALLAAKTDQPIGTELPLEVVRHMRQDRVLASFVDNVWSEMARCANCHSPERNRDRASQLGEDEARLISWLVPNDPDATLDRLYEQGDINLAEPEASPLLAKPSGRIKHGGGPKFLPGDPAYRKFLTFLTDYAAVRRGRYESQNDLPTPPPEQIFLTMQQLRVTGFPEPLGEIPWQVDLFVRDRETREWRTDRVGTVFGKINTEQHLGQGMVSVVYPAGHSINDEVRSDPSLPHGPWRARLYIDREHRTEHDPLYKLSADEYVGEMLIDGDWPPGYQPPKIVEFSRFHIPAGR
jgi:hypothetical protein